MTESFENAVERLFGDEIRSDDKMAELMWSALSNVVWRSKDGQASYSFRAAGGFIAEIRGKGYYLDWYCCAPAGYVSDRISKPLKTAGWNYEVIKA